MNTNSVVAVPATSFTISSSSTVSTILVFLCYLQIFFISDVMPLGKSLMLIKKRIGLITET